MQKDPVVWVSLNGLVAEEKPQLHNRKLLLVRMIGGELENGDKK